MSSDNLRYSLRSRRHLKQDGGLTDEPCGGEHRPSTVAAGSATAGHVQPATHDHKPQPAADEQPNTSASSRQSCDSSESHTATGISGAASSSSTATLVASTASNHIQGIPLEDFTYGYLASRGVFTSPGSIQPPTSNVRGAVRSSRDVDPVPAPPPPPTCCAVCASSAEAANGQTTPETTTDGDDTGTVALSSSGYDSDETIAADGPDWTV
ncbi:hypothetical protein MAPG_11829 [Magnaporthiopsis poae ATCC 64411]|uniref:Uncharacterized protein n=1 Tax=Magnaporthiopsis poae (strain ATCC 64411 / 73-15) TaxID=644358 RepID=A0A0C4EGA2_MAGP6|nr:hypothetical protein MAPG_11829 [Magnaporthiopsis poae ATCC 64411]